MSAWREWNPNPAGRRVGDCAVRAIAKALGISWEQAYCRLCTEGYTLCDIMNANSAWGALLHENGFRKESISNTCPDCYTIEDFCKDNPRGLFVIATSGHVVTAENGQVWDSWDSTKEIPIYYYRG